jgi:indole-3-glycerol phosphate synthase
VNDILQRIVDAKRQEVAALKPTLPLAEVRSQAETAVQAGPTRDFTGALKAKRPRGSGRSVHVIAEIKRRSPSKGEFPWKGDAAAHAKSYERGGARCISVVTDGPFFGGSVELLQTVRRAQSLPVIQKEFVLDPWQVYRARAIGADALLLIVACLPGALLGELHALARELGLHVLVEVIDEAEFRRADDAGATIIGVNNRDLRTFTVDPARTERLLPLYRVEQVAVCESGIHTPADVARMLRVGVDGFLIGEALMTAPDAAAHLTRLRVDGAALADAPAAAPQAMGAAR